MVVRLWGQEQVVNVATVRNQLEPQLVRLANGNLLIVWEDSSAANSNIRARIYGQDGRPVTGEFNVGQSPGDDRLPQVLALPDGGFQVAFETTLGGVPGRFIDTFSPSGAAVGPNNFQPRWSQVQVLASPGGGLSHVEVYRESASGELRLSTFNASGALSGTTTLAGAGEEAVYPNIARLNLAPTSHVVVWDSEPTNTIRMKIVGAINTATFDVNASGGVTLLPEVVALSNGGYVVTWASNASSFPESGFNVRYRVFAANGNPLSPDAQVNIGEVAGVQAISEVIALRDGGFLVLWLDEPLQRVRGQQFNGVGDRVGGEFSVGEVASFSGLEAELLSDGRVAVTWTDIERDGSGEAVVLRILDPRDGLVDGRAGDDVIYGGAGADQVLGFGGADKVYSGAGADVVEGGSGDDLLNGDDGDDLLEGGAGNDIVSGLRGNDTAYGGAGVDLVDGGAGDDELFGDAGNDTMRGGAGLDVLDGGEGVDYVDFRDRTVGVDVRLASGEAFVGGVLEDSFTGFENVHGSAVADLLTGDGDANTLNGAGGDDRLVGLSGADTLDGGEGRDTADYSYLTVSLSLTLNGAVPAAARINGANEDTVANVEDVVGGAAADVLQGDAAGNRLDGRAGNDVLRGAGGNDILIGGAGLDTADFTAKTERIDILLRDGGEPSNVFVGGVLEDTIEGVEVVYGGAAGDVLRGDGGANLFRGGPGADLLDGGGGVDSVDYRDKVVAVVLTLADVGVTTAVVDGMNEDTVQRMENIYGGSIGDTLTGNGGANLLSGEGGVDVLIGRAGADQLNGGAGQDFFLYEALGDSTPLGTGRDQINAFVRGEDQIVLSAIDAIAATPENEAFVFIGSASFAANQPGQVRVVNPIAGLWSLEADVNGDAVADFAITVFGALGPDAGSLVL